MKNKMICVIQRVKISSIKINNSIYSKIGKGLNVLVGLERNDTEKDLTKAINKIINLRIFPNEEGKFYYSVKDIEGEILLVSQFTLLGDITKGRRPDFTNAMEANKAKEYFERLIEEFKKIYIPSKIKTGVFQQEMEVEIINDGPVTIIIDTQKI